MIWTSILALTFVAETGARPVERLAAMALERQEAGKPGEAAALMREALRKARRESGEDARAGVLLNGLGSAYQDLGLGERAERCYRRAVAILEAADGRTALALVAPLDNLGSLYLDEAKPARAEAPRLRALAIRLNRSGLLDAGSGTMLHHLGSVYSAVGEWRKADALFGEAERILTRSGMHRALEPLWNDQAVLLMREGRPAEAAARLARVVAAIEKSRGPRCLDLARPLANLASALAAEARFGEAAAVFERARILVEDTLGPEDPLLACLLESYASSLRRAKCKPEAKALEKQARRIRERGPGANVRALAIDVSEY